MRLNQDEIELFKQLSGSGTGKGLLSYIRRLQADLFEPKTLTKDNLEARKETAAALEEFADRIKYAGEDIKKDDVDPYA